MGELLLLYVDDTLDDVTPFGKVRSRAFRIMPADALRSTGKLLTETPVSQLDLRWLAVDQQNGLCTKNLRTLAMAVPKRLRNFLLNFDQHGNPFGLRGDRYEFWVYRQLRRRLDTGDIHLDDSVEHRCFADDLVSMEA